MVKRTEQFMSKGLKSLSEGIFVTNKTRLAQFEQELAAAQARGNQESIEKYTRLITNLKKKSTQVSTANVAAKYAANKLKAATTILQSNKLEMAKLEMKLNRTQKAGLNTSNLQSRIGNLQKKMTTRVEQKEMAEHKKNEAREAVERKKSEARAAAENVERQKKALRNAVVAARLQMNSAQPEPSQGNRLAYATALQAYKNAGLSMNNRNGSLGRLKYNSTGVLRRSTTQPKKTTLNTHYDFIRNVRSKLSKTSNPRDKSKLLDEALSNLSKRLYATSNNRRALEMIDNYRRISSNTGYTSHLNRRAERRKPKKNENENKNKKSAGWSGGGGQQIIFGQPGGGGAAPAMNRSPAAPVFIPTGGGGAAPAPMMIPGGGGAGPSISVNPTIRVNVSPAAAQAATQMLPPMERSALNNAGGYRRAASLVQGAGGPESVSRALNALETSNGNVTKAMAKTGLPKNVFANVNKLGGPVTARRALTAVKKVSRRTRGAPPSKGRAPVRRAGKPKAAAKKKYVSSACATCGKRSSTNQIKLVISQLRRNNLEKNFLKCLLP